MQLNALAITVIPGTSVSGTDVRERRHHEHVTVMRLAHQTQREPNAHPTRNQRGSITLDSDSAVNFNEHQTARLG
jgi:hypothetical protein